MARPLRDDPAPPLSRPMVRAFDTTWPSSFATSWVSPIQTTSKAAIRLHTLSLTRWVAVVGQLFTILFVHYSLGIVLPIQWLVPAIAVSAAINLFLTLTLHAATRLSERSALLLFGYDIVQLGYLLALTGGLRNAFAALVAVPLMLGAATLGLRSTVLLSLLAVATLTFLAFVPTPLPWFELGLAFPVFTSQQSGPRW